VFTVTVTLYNKGKRGKDAEVAEVTLELATLRNTDEAEEWFPLSGVTPIGNQVTYRYLRFSPAEARPQLPSL
jgi:hypothetical protein